MTHSFFAGMGGFVFDTEDADCLPYIRGSPRLIVTAHGVAKLAEHGHLPNIPETLIADKSKADFVAKVFATLQASWFLVQCVARWKARLTITLLELNTLAHVFCALLIYLLWMNKPYDVHEPIRITGEWVRPLCATMWMFSRISTEKHRERRSKITNQPEIERLLFADVSHLRSSHRVRKQNHEANTEREVTAPMEDEEDLTLPPPHGEDIELRLKRQEISINVLPSTSKSNGRTDPYARSFICLSDKTSVNRYGRETDGLLNNMMCPETGFGPKQESVHFMKRNISRTKVPDYITPRVEIKITGIRLTRWRLASSVLRENQLIWGQYAEPYERIPEVEAGCPIYEYRAKNLNDNFVDPKVKNWPGDDLLGRENKLLRSLLLSFATAAYGGIHASAWNEFFATASERNWWRFSSVFIAASGVVMSLRTIGSQATDRLIKMKSQWLRYVLFIFVGIPLGYSATIAVTIYVIVRFYLVVEALLSLRQLPINAYQTPRFVQSIPHL